MKYKKEEIIQSIIKMRIEKGHSKNTILNNFLMGQLEYQQSYAYQLYREAQDQIRELYKVNASDALDDAVGQLESMYEDAIAEKNKKLALEIKKEIHKLVGLYAAEKVDITSGGKSITEITLVNVTKSIDEINKEDEPKD